MKLILNYLQTMIYWTIIDPVMVVGDPNDHGRFSHQRRDVSSKRRLKYRRNLVEKFVKLWRKIQVLVYVWCKYGSKINGRKWKSCKGKRRPSLDRIKNQRRNVGQKVLIVITVRIFILIITYYRIIVACKYYYKIIYYITH